VVPESARPRLNGSKSASTSSSSTTAPVLETRSSAVPPEAPTLNVISPRGRLYSAALRRRFRARARKRPGSPLTTAGSSSVRTVRPRSSIADETSSSASAATSARSRWSLTSAAASLRARASRLCTRWSLRLTESSTVVVAASRSSADAAGSARLTSTAARMTASGVRSSCDASAMKRRWLETTASRRASMPSGLSARRFSSSSRPWRAIRSPRFDSERRAASR
jgi:hypothetical protein